MWFWSTILPSASCSNSITKTFRNPGSKHPAGLCWRSRPAFLQRRPPPMAGERLRLCVLLLGFTPQFSSAQDQLSNAPSRDDQVAELRKLQEASDWEGILRQLPI